MLAMLEHARRMRELSHFASNFHKLTVDSNLRAQSGYWKIATAMYTTLLRLANDEPNLKMALAPVVAFFAKGPRAPRAADATPANIAAVDAVSKT